MKNEKDLFLKLEILFLVSTAWFIFGVLSTSSFLLYELIQTAAQSSTRLPFQKANFVEITISAVSTLTFAGFSFILSTIFRNLAHQPNRFSFNYKKVFLFTFWGFLAKEVYDLLFWINIYIKDVLQSEYYSTFWMKFLGATSIFDYINGILFAIAFYFLYLHFNRLQKFEKEVI